MYLVEVPKCGQLVVSVGNTLYSKINQFPPVLTRTCGHAVLIIRDTRIYNLQFLVQFPSLFSKCTDMKYKIILHM